MISREMSSLSSGSMATQKYRLAYLPKQCKDINILCTCTCFSRLWKSYSLCGRFNKSALPIGIVLTAECIQVHRERLLCKMSPFVHDLRLPILQNVTHLGPSTENSRHEFPLDFLLFLLRESLVPFLEAYLALPAE